MSQRAAAGGVVEKHISRAAGMTIELVAITDDNSDDNNDNVDEEEMMN